MHLYNAGHRWSKETTWHNSIRSWHWMGMCESVSDSPIYNPRPQRPNDPWTKAWQPFADKSQDTDSPKTGETIKPNWKASNNKQWVNDPARSRSPVNCYSLGALIISRRVPCLPTSKLYARKKISIPWSQHSVRFTNIREHCVSRPWALRNCLNPWDSRVIRETWRVWICLWCQWLFPINCFLKVCVSVTCGKRSGASPTWQETECSCGSVV